MKGLSGSLGILIAPYEYNKDMYYWQLGQKTELVMKKRKGYLVLHWLWRAIDTCVSDAKIHITIHILFNYARFRGYTRKIYYLQAQTII